MSAERQPEVPASAKARALDMLRYHAPTAETIPKYEGVNSAFQGLADALYDLMPDGPGKTYALVCVCLIVAGCVGLYFI